MKIVQAKEFYIRLDKECDIKSLARELNSSQENILRNNPDIAIYPGEMIKVKTNDYISHIVRPTETLDLIANKYKTSKNRLVLDNNLASEKLYIGQIIKIYEKSTN